MTLNTIFNLDLHVAHQTLGNNNNWLVDTNPTPPDFICICPHSHKSLVDEQHT
jgi:hypothetical protein